MSSTKIIAESVEFLTTASTPLRDEPLPLSITRTVFLLSPFARTFLFMAREVSRIETLFIPPSAFISSTKSLLDFCPSARITFASFLSAKAIFAIVSSLLFTTPKVTPCF